MTTGVGLTPNSSRQVNLKVNCWPLYLQQVNKINDSNRKAVLENYLYPGPPRPNAPFLHKTASPDLNFQQRHPQLLSPNLYHIRSSCGVPSFVILLFYPHLLRHISGYLTTMHTNMDDQQMAHTNTRAAMTNSMVHALDSFITPNLSQHGWLTTDEDNHDLSCEILKNFVDLCHAGNSRRFILETLSDDRTHLEMAQWLSTIFLGHNPAPRDRRLLSFTDSVVKFFHDLCWDHFVHFFTADDGSQIVADSGLYSYAQASRQTVGPI